MIPRKILLVFLLLAISTLPVAAEVAVSLDDGGTIRSIHVGSIVDETDPINSWSPFGTTSPNRIALNPDGDTNGDGPPGFLHDSTRTDPIVVWASNGAQGYDIVASRFTAGAWTAPVVVAGGADDELDPVVVLDPDADTLHVFYWTPSPAPRILWTQGNLDLTGWQAPLPVSAPGDIALRPSATFHRGVLEVAYENHFSGLDLAPREIVVATHDGGGLFSWQAPQITLHAEPNRPQLHSSQGRMWLDWVDASGVMGWIREAAEPGSWEPMQTEAFQSVEEREFGVRQTIRLLAID